MTNGNDGTINSQFMVVFKKIVFLKILFVFFRLQTLVDSYCRTNVFIYH